VVCVAEWTVSLCSLQASELAAVAPKPKLRFAECVWQLAFGDKKLFNRTGYFWRCAALRYALHAVNVANEVCVLFVCLRILSYDRTKGRHGGRDAAAV
jgi:hypothetical protein